MKIPAILTVAGFIAAIFLSGLCGGPLSGEEERAQGRIDAHIATLPVSLIQDQSLEDTADIFKLGLTRQLNCITRFHSDKMALEYYQQIAQANPFHWWKSREIRRNYLKMESDLNHALQTCHDGLLAAKTAEEANNACWGLYTIKTPNAR